MKSLKIPTAALLGALLSTCVYAEETGPAVEYRSVGDMSVEERMDMMKATSKYNDCVFNKAVSRIDDFEDIRQIADIALGECEQKLDEVRSVIQSAGFDPGFADAFSARARNRATHKLLPELAIRKSGG